MHIDISGIYSYEKMGDLTIEHRTLDNSDVLDYASHIPKKNIKFTVKDDIVLDQSKHIVSVSGESSITVQKNTESEEQSLDLDNKEVPPIESNGFYYLTLLECIEMKQDHLRDTREIASVIETDTLLAKIDISELRPRLTVILLI